MKINTNFFNNMDLPQNFIVMILFLLIFSSTLLKTKAQHPAVFVRLLNSDNNHAVCLDGSPSGYYFSKGYGEGANNWVVFLEGGAWCGGGYCQTWIQGKTTYKLPDTLQLTGILGHDQTLNPDFYNWNRVRVVYCDGASFMGDAPFDKGKNLTRKGMKIFKYMMKDLLAKGMQTANNAILTGSSAGGLAAMLHCDMFRSLVDHVKTVKCIADSGFFLAGTDPSLPGFNLREHRFDVVVERHDVAKFLPKECTSRLNSTLCMFPQNIIQNIKTPLFIIESGFDSYQMSTGIGNIDTSFTHCTHTMSGCTPSDIQTMKDFRRIFIETLKEKVNGPARGLFVHSCVAHSHFDYDSKWSNPRVAVGGKNIQQAVGDWYFERRPVYDVDVRDVELSCVFNLNLW